MLAKASGATLVALLFCCSTVVVALDSSRESLEQRLNILENEFAKEKAQKDAEVHSLKVKVQSLEVEVQALSVENKDLISAKATLEERVEYLEAITRNDVPRTCQDLRNLGVTKSGTYLVDPDGPGLGDAPISVFCDMASGRTVVPHDLVGTTVEVEHCADPGCHSTIVKYDATARQLKALVDLSQECFQDFEYNCFVAPLIESVTNMAWWIGADGRTNYYWDGSHDPNLHTCACGQDGSCINENYSCNCDSGLPQWMTDAGSFTNMASLPVSELRFGGLLVDGQQATFELSPLNCRGRKAFVATESCETLRLAGHTASGYYQVDGTNGLGYNLVHCDMGKESDDPALETPTAIKLPEYQVSFDADSPKSVGTGNVLTYGRVVTNEGNAFNKDTGTFVAPFDGVYSFTISLLSGSSGGASFYLRLNGVDTAVVYDEFSGYSNMAMTVLLTLSASDSVDIYLAGGDVRGDNYTHFTGTLLHPL